MVRHRKSGFSVVIFEKKQARSQRLAEFLTVYVQNVAAAHRTKTNELVEFLEKPDEGRVVVYFGLSYYDKPCGFATLMVYPDSYVGVVDHLTISQTSRGFGAFFAFSDLISEYLDDNRIALNYLVAEVALGEQALSTGVTPLTLVRLLRFLGFRLANLRYYAPDPLIVGDKESCRAALMLITRPDKQMIGSDELVSILKVIYFKHYGEWYRRVMTTEVYSKYEVAIKSAFIEIEDFVRASRLIKINGMKNFELPYTVEPGKPIGVGVIGNMILIALPAIITIALAFEQQTRLTVAIAGATVITFALTLVPRFRRLLLRFFQLER
jgi:hypothetical protein